MCDSGQGRTGQDQPLIDERYIALVSGECRYLNSQKPDDKIGREQARPSKAPEGVPDRRWPHGTPAVS